MNVVLVGYEDVDGPQGVAAADLMADQPQVSLGIARYPLFFDRLLPTYTAILPQFQVTYADTTFEDAFFGHLSSIAEPTELTAYQAGYNQQPQRTQTVADPVVIDGPAVEDWLGDHAADLGVDASEPTLFLVNWFGRSDFRFHTYTRIGEPDSDTGRDAGLFESRRLIAWGGTPAGAGEPERRVWFHDLSAGPEYNTDNYDITNADVDGDGLDDYRMPPVWEYGNLAGYRPFDDLAGDLGKILRYVFFDMMVAASPIYSPTISPPQLPDVLGVDITRIRAAGQGPAPVQEAVVRAAHSDLAPWTTIRISERTIPYDGVIRRVTRCWYSGWTDPSAVGDSCYGRGATGFAYYDMFVYLTSRLNQFVWTPAEHSVPVLLYEVPDEETHPVVIGIAEPDYRNGDQFNIAMFRSPSLTAAGYGQTDVLVHELGHHVGLAHPHDGLDFEGGFDFNATGDFFFVWTGDESASVMSYLDLANEFSQFERDSMGRWMTAAFLNQSNQVLARIMASPRSARVNAEIIAADGFALDALLATGVRSYAEAALSAERAYDTLTAAAARIGVQIEPQAQPADRKGLGRSYMFVDPIPPVATDRPATPGPGSHPVELEEMPRVVPFGG